MRSSLVMGAVAFLAAVAPGLAAADMSGNVAFRCNTLDNDSDSKEDYLALSGAVAISLGSRDGRELAQLAGRVDWAGDDAALIDAVLAERRP